MEAKELKMVPIQRQEMLPDGVKVLIVTCDGAAELKVLPKALLFNDEVYGRTGWNSDANVAYYRTDKAVATPW